MEKDLSNEEIESKLKEFQEWINEQEDLPKNFGNLENLVGFIKKFEMKKVALIFFKN